MTKTQLQIFLSVCRTKSRTKTASDLNYTLPNITKALNTIEREYQITLFKCTKDTSMQLTSDGILLYQHCLRFIEQHNNLINTLHKNAEKKEVNIGLFLSAGDFIFPAIHNSLALEFPEITFHYFIHNKSTLLDLWDQNRLDFLVCDGYIRDIHSVGRKIYHDDLDFYKSVGSSIPDILSLTDLAHQPLILQEEGSSMRTQLEALMKEIGLPLAPVIECSSRLSILRMVISNIGISILSSVMTSQLIESGIVSRIDIPGLHFQRDFYLYSKGCEYPESIINRISDFIALKFEDWIEEANPIPKYIDFAQANLLEKTL